MEIRQKKVWSGSYRGIDFEINNFTRDKEYWTFYLYLIIEAIPEEAKPKSFLLRKNGKTKYYNYYNHPVISYINFHGGITWYSKEDENRAIKIGCDYSHYWDEGRVYNLDSIIIDVKEAINSFREIVPDYKYRCLTVGGYWPKDEGSFYENNGDSKFISNKGKRWRKKQGWETLAILSEELF